MKKNKEVTKVRTPEDVNQEYSQICINIGDKSVKIDALHQETKRLEDSNFAKIKALQNEINELKDKVPALVLEMAQIKEVK